jgi:3-oxosteroid 1-dehydrogenase
MVTDAPSRARGRGDESDHDFVIVGSGGGSMCAALAAQALGKRPLIIEKLAEVGGSTGYSGGVLWIPNSPTMRRAGIADSYQRARTYLDACVGGFSPGSTDQRRAAFLQQGPRCIEFLESAGMKFLYADGYSDYYDELPGGEARGRCLVAPLFDMTQLGDWAQRLSRNRQLDIPIGVHEVADLLLVKRTWAGKLMAMRLAGRLLAQKLTGKKFVAWGAAVQGRMLQIALRQRIPIWTETPVTALMTNGGRVTGVVARREGREIEVRARDGVLINAGGFSRNARMRERYLPKPTNVLWTKANPGDTGEMQEAAMALGAAVDCMDEAWWIVQSLGPGETFPHLAYGRDGKPWPFGHHIDMSMPHLMMVDQVGQRYVNESASYMEIGKAQYQRHAQTGCAVPSWMIMEARARQRYSWGAAAPGVTPPEWLASGYMKKADSLEALAAQCGIEAAGLRQTVMRFNGHCRTGVDLDFRRGARAFDRHHGDPTVRPNPNLGAIEQAPFYAVAIYPGDVGTCGGLVTDHDARVLRADGSEIEGLYATGNSTASVVGRTYPGAGASVAASFVFGYIAAQHAAGARSVPT